MSRNPTFTVVETGDRQPGGQLIFGITHPGMAGVTTANYLVEELDVEQIGHVKSRNFPAIAPFEDGQPRHPMRLYTCEKFDLTIFVGDLFVPVWAAEAFARGFLEWVEGTDIEEVVVPYGVPFPHSHEQHEVFYTATPAFRDHRLADTEIEGFAGGFLDGISAELVLAALEGTAPPTGVFITPAHPPGPDLEAALLLLDVIQRVCSFTVDEKTLRESADQMREYYTELASRMEALSQSDGSVADQEYPEDRMFM